MRTVLDEGSSWFVESLAYGDELHVVLVEGIRSSTPEDLEIGSHVIKDTYAGEPSTQSRRASIHFRRTVAWQVVDESYTALDKAEVRDGKDFLAVLTQSPYLQFVEAHHGWFKDVVGPAVHYQLWTENDVIDVVAHDEPIVQLLTGTQQAAGADRPRAARR